MGLRLRSYGIPAALRDWAIAAQVPESQSGVPVVDRRFVRAAHARGLQVHVWTVNEPDRMRGWAPGPGRRWHHDRSHRHAAQGPGGPGHLGLSPLARSVQGSEGHGWAPRPCGHRRPTRSPNGGASSAAGTSTTGRAPSTRRACSPCSWALISTSVAKHAADADGFVHPLGIPVRAGSFFAYTVSASVIVSSIFATPMAGAAADRTGRT